MSIGPTLVRADDDNFYINAEIEGEDFFLCFDEDDPAELVIKKNERPKDDLLKRVDEVIAELNIKATILKENTKEGIESHRCFGPEDKMYPAFAVFLDITKPLPHTIITKHDGIYKGKGSGTFECFEEMDFPAWRKAAFGEDG